MVQISPFIHALSTLAQVTSQQTSSDELLVRQSSVNPLSSLPSQCQSTCTAIITVMNCGNNQSCLCANSVGSGLVTCFDCLEAAEPNNSTLQSLGQTAIQDYNQACGTSLTLSGSSPGNSSGSPGNSTGSGSSSGAVSLKAAGMGVFVVAAAIGSMFL